MKLGIIVSIWLLLGLASVVHNAEISSVEEPDLSRWSQISRLLSWNEYKVSFHKVYPSLSEECMRKWLFMGELIGTFRHNIGYLRGNVHYYNVINEYSDITPQEREKLLSGNLVRTTNSTPITVEAEKHSKSVELDEIEALPNNHVSGLFGTAFSYLMRPIVWGHGKYSGEQNKPDESHLEEKSRMVVDHRTSKCVPEPRQQFLCGGCYAFASIFALEYELCQLVGKIVPLSEQYVIDCAVQEHDNLGSLGKGCSGGSLQGLHQFYNNYGVMLRKNSPYRAALGTCPYKERDGIKKRGDLRTLIRESEFLYGHSIDLEKIDELLRRSPVMVGIQVGPDILAYGGGVYDGDTCAMAKTNHAVVIIGEGIENDIPFYLLRDSYGRTFGNFKMSKKSVKLCLVMVLTWSITFDKNEVEALKLNAS